MNPIVTTNATASNTDCNVSFLTGSTQAFASQSRTRYTVIQRLGVRDTGHTLAPSLRDVRLDQLELGYLVKIAIPIRLEPSDDSVVATFAEANINASGDTDLDALRNLVSLILDTFDRLSSYAPEKLGPSPRRQLHTLHQFISKLT